MQPLQWPDNFTPAASLWDWIPFLAWFSPRNARYAEVAEDIRRQLLQRQAPDPAVWGSDPVRLQTARSLCRWAQKQYAYPNDHFLPDDPFEIVFQMPWDDLEVVEFMICMEEAYDIAIADEECRRWRTLGDVVDSLTIKVRELSRSRRTG
jgi:acyl carrier protein